MNGVQQASIFLAIALALGHLAAQAADPAYLPKIEASDLNGKPRVLPNDLATKRALLFVAFEREQQEAIDSWVNGLGLNSVKAADVNWLELPVIENPGAFGRWFIDTGMRGGIPSVNTRSRVVTVYTEKAKFKSAMKIASEASIVVVVVGRDGRVLARAEGEYSAAKAAPLLKA